MKAIIYSRVSHVSGQNGSRQVNELKAVVGYDVKKVFQESISGYTKSIDERPVLVKALKYVKDNDIEVIMVHEISRLGRKTPEILTLIDSCKKDGIKIYVKSLDMLINSETQNNAVNMLVVTLLTDLSRMESEQMSYRIKSGLQERKRKGMAIGRQYGSTVSEVKFLQKHARTVRYLNKGESIRWIANQLSISPTTVQKVKNLQEHSVA